MKRLLLVTALIIGIIIGQAVCLEVDVSSSSGGTTTEMSTSYETTINDFVVHDIKLTPQDGGISNHQYGTGGFTKTISSKDASGNIAKSYANVVASNPGSPITQYWSELSAVPGSGLSQEWLTVQNAKSIVAFSQAYSPDGKNQAGSSISINPSIAPPTTLASLDYWSRAYIDSNGFNSEQQAYPGKGNTAPANDVTPAGSPSVPDLASGASGDRVVFTESSYDSSGDYASSVLDAKCADVHYYNGGAYVRSDGVNVLSGSQTSSSGGITAYSRSLDNYVKSTGSYGDKAQSSVSLTGSSKLEYATYAVSQEGTEHTSQTSAPEISISPNPYDSGATSASVTFTESVLKGGISTSDGYYSLSNLIAKDAKIPYYHGDSDIADSVKTESWSQTLAGVNNPSAGSISAYSQALGNYMRSTGAYSDLAKSSAYLASSTETASLDYHTLALSNPGGLDTMQQTFNGASSSTPPTPGTYGAKGDSITFAEISYNRLGGVTNDYASSSLVTKKATIYDYEGSATTTDTDANVETYVPSDSGGQGVQSSQSITYQTYAKDKDGKYAKSSASVIGSQMSGPAASNFGTASSEDSAVQSSINGLNASGNTISVTGDESDVANRYYLTGYASGSAQYLGTVTSTMGTGAEQQISSLAGTGNVYLKDYRKNGEDVQYATLYPLAKSFAGTAFSRDTGHIIQDNVDRASSINNDKLYLSAGTFNENVVIDKSLIINGARASNTIVNGMKRGSVFEIGWRNSNIDVTLSGMNITGGSGTVDTIYEYHGGGIHNRGRTTVRDCSISKNSADGGGGIYNYAGTFAMKGVTISGNTAYGDGGGVLNFYGTFTMNGGTISGNSALADGGGVYNQLGGTFMINGGTISGNSAEKHSGGGVYNDYGSTFTMNGGTISGNSASEWYGGGVKNDGTFTMNSGIISGNSAYYGGGVMSIGALTMTGGAISGNSATAEGGGIYNHYGILLIKGTSQIINNLATIGYGGGIYSDGSITFDGTEIAIKSNNADLPNPLPTDVPWYQQYGVYIYSATPTTKNGFNPDEQVTGNTHI